MIIKVLTIAFATIICGVVIREYDRPYMLVLSLAAGALIALLIAKQTNELFDKIMSMAQGMEQTLSYVKLMLKALVIVLSSQLVCEICRDNGQNALASFVEIAVKIVLVAMVMPLFDSIISIVGGLVK